MTMFQVKKMYVLERFFFYSVVIMGVRRGVRGAHAPPGRPKIVCFLTFFEFVFWCFLSKKYALATPGKFCPPPHGKSLRTPMVVILQNKSIAGTRTNKLQLL